jgi:hypothetical protein
MLCMFGSRTRADAPPIVIPASSWPATRIVRPPSDVFTIHSSCELGQHRRKSMMAAMRTLLPKFTPLECTKRACHWNLDQSYTRMFQSSQPSAHGQHSNAE